MFAGRSRLVPDSDAQCATVDGTASNDRQEPKFVVTGMNREEGIICFCSEKYVWNV